MEIFLNIWCLYQKFLCAYAKKCGIQDILNDALAYTSFFETGRSDTQDYISEGRVKG
jgi:hypothetical protein